MDLNEAKQKASKCLGCANPKCVEGCPIHTNIPGFIKCIKEEDLEGAYKIILEKNYFGVFAVEFVHMMFSAKETVY